MKKIDYKKSGFILQAGTFIGFIISFISCGIVSSTENNIIFVIIAFIGLIIMIVSIGQAYFFYRCPFCDENFNIRARMPDYCPKCGKNWINISWYQLEKYI